MNKMIYNFKNFFILAQAICFFSKSNFIRIKESETIINELYEKAKKSSLSPNKPKKKEKIIFLMEKSHSQNAFATQIYEGPIIAITIGLVSQMESADELLAVILHEMGHLAHEHVLTPLKGLSSFDYLALIASSAIMTATTGAAGAIGSFEMLKQAKYRSTIAEVRVRENEADAFAVNALTENNWPVDGMIEIMERWRFDGAGSQYQYTHPLPENRSKRALYAKKDMQKNPKSPQSIKDLFYHLKKLAKVYSNAKYFTQEKLPLYYELLNLQIKKRWALILKKYESSNEPKDEKTKIIYITSLISLNQFEKAEKLLNEIDAKNDEKLALEAEIKIEKKEYSKAQRLIEKSKQLDPLSSKPWQLEAKIMSYLGFNPQSWYARAQEFLIEGDIENAKKYAKLAQNNAKKDSTTYKNAVIFLEKLKKLY